MASPVVSAGVSGEKVPGIPKSPRPLAGEPEAASRSTLTGNPDLPDESWVWVPGIPQTWGMGESSVRQGKKVLHEWKRAIWLSWRSKYQEKQLPGPVELSFIFLLPSSGSSLRKDLTNLVKGAEDGLKNIAFGDDRLVYRTTARKEPVTEGAGMYFKVEPYRGPVSRQDL